MSQNYQYNTIEEALRDLKEGKIILVTDDPDRENEGDLICAAEFATRENIIFMATYAKGLICTQTPAAYNGLIYHGHHIQIPDLRTDLGYPFHLICGKCVSGIQLMQKIYIVIQRCFFGETVTVIIMLPHIDISFSTDLC